MTTDSQLADLFIQDTARHQLTVLHDQGLYRHLRWAVPGSGINAVEITTIPGALFVSGDMGSWSFQRHGTDDLLRTGFFTGGPRYGYWASKCEAADRRVGLREFSPEALKATVDSYIEDWADGDESARFNLGQETETILEAETVEDAFERLAGFSYAGLHFDDVDDASVTEFTFQYRWICRALVKVSAEYAALDTPQAAAA